MRRFGKTGARLLCAVFAFCLFLPATARAEDSGKPGIKTLSQIVLSVGDGQKAPVYKAGEKAQLKINVLNKGNADAENVTITPVIDNTEDWPFEIDQLNYDQDLGAIKAGSQASASWGSGDDKLTVRSDVTGKSYRLVFRLAYDDGDRAYETERYVFVKTEAKKGSSGEGGSGNSQGGSQTGGSSGVSGGSGGSGSGDAALAGDDGYAAVSNGDPVALGGDSSGASDGSVPRVIVTGFDTDPGVVKAGNNFKLVIHLKNTSKKTAVTNMLFDLQAPASGEGEAAEAPAFLPVSGSSSIYLDRIPADGTKDISIDLNSRADLIQKPYSITMTMKYEDANATQFEGESSLAVPVTQDARFEFSKIQIMPDTVAVYEEANITCNLYNLGRVKMYNVKARFEGEAIEGQEQFIGNLESGATGTIDGIVTAAAESYDENNCRLVLTYEDDAGQEYTVEQPFTMTVTAEMEMGDMEVMTDIPEENGIPAGLIIAIAAAVAAAAGITAVILLKRRKRKLQSSEEEELMDEVERLTEDERRQP